MLFDHIAVAARFVRRGDGGDRWVPDAPRRVRAEVDWLAEQGVLLDSSARPFRRHGGAFDTEAASQSYESGFWYMAIPEVLEFSINTRLGELEALRGLATLIPGQVCESVTVFLRDTTFSGYGASFMDPEGPRPLTPTTVLEVAYGALPQPDDRTPWEAIIEWRNDEGARAQLRRLQRWTREIVHRADSLHGAADELQYLLDEYRQYMKLHRMKVNVGAARTLLTVATGSLEDLVKFRWEKAADRLFILKDRQIALTEAERCAPGREVAYIVSTRARFEQP